MPVKRRNRSSRSLTFISALLLSSAIAVPAIAQIEEVVVTAQKKSEDIQNVPISISAYTSEDLKAHQITQFKDLVFSTPNVSYTKGNFTGSNFQIRGIGITAVGYDSESGVAVHKNDVYLSSPPLAEATFYDLERIEVLRGPQSTLYGRGATGGTVNIITAKPNLDEFHANLEGTYGNYNTQEVKGMVNIPIIEGELGVRIAGDWHKRDGIVKNIANNSDIDGRNQYSFRGTVRWQPTSRTTIDITGETSKENDDHMRMQKQFCTSDPTGVLGCLPNSLGTGVTNVNASLATIASSRQGLASFGSAVNPALVPFFANMGIFDLTVAPVAPAPANILNPPNLRQVNTDFHPVYKAKDQYLALNVKQEVTPWLEATFVGGWDKNNVFSQESYNNVGGLPFDPVKLGTAEANFLGTLQAVAVGAGYTPAQAAAYAANYKPYFAVPGALPLSGFGNNGIVGGNIAKYSNTVTAVDQSNGHSNQLSAELRFNSNFQGPLNFMIAGYYLRTHTGGDYFVNANTFDYPGFILGAFQGLGLPGRCLATGCIAPGYYHNFGDTNTLVSKSMFGEVYWDAVPDTLKVTLGARYTDDSKYQRGRIQLFSGVIPIGSSNEKMALAQYGGDFDAARPGNQLWQINQVSFKKWTGRAVVSWTPKLDFTDQTSVYASYARGYKAGGFNPGISPGLGVPSSYAPEQIDAFELGTKNLLAGGTLQANMDVWYYNYKGLQVSAIIANTSVNQNINAKLWGVEGEFLWAPTSQLQFNLNLGTTHSSIGNVSLIDQRNLTAGRKDTVLVKDATLGSTIGQNCVLYMINGQTVSPADNAAFQATPGLAGTYFAPPGGSTSIAAAGVANANYGLCGKQIPEATMNAFGYSYSDPKGTNQSDGVAVSLSGNRLQNTPSLTVSLGAQWTQPLADEWNIVARADFYYQTHMWARIFNASADRIGSRTVTNLQLTLNAPENKYYVTGYVKNVFNKTDITGEYLTSATSGLYTNAFLGDPRMYGLTVGVRF